MLSPRCPFILSIILAALTSLAVPWLIAVTVRLETGVGPSALVDPSGTGQLPMWLAHEFSQPGARTILAIPVTTELQHDTYLTWRAELSDDVIPPAYEIDDVTGQSPASSSLRQPPPAHTQAIYEYRVGWPLLALTSRVTRVHDPESPLLDDLVLRVDGGIPIKELTTPRTIRNLPCRPLWLGLIVNTVMFWVAWMTVIILMRHRLRPAAPDDATTVQANDSAALLAERDA